jgi:hypothetical protein
MADIKKIMTTAAANIKAVFGTAKANIKKVGSGGALPSASTLESLAIADDATHLYTFVEAPGGVVADQIGSLDLTLTGLSVSVSTTGVASGCSGKLILADRAGAGTIASADWTRTADRSIEIVMDQFGGALQRSFLLGPGGYNAGQNFANLNTYTGGGGTSGHWNITDAAWTKRIELGSSGLTTSLSNELVYLCISWNHSTTTLRARGRRASGGSTFNLTDAGWSAGSSGTGWFYIGGNVLGGVHGGNIYTNSTMHVHHFAVYDKVLSDVEVAERISVLGLS